MGFSITSVVKGVIIIYFYGFAVDYYSDERGSRRYRGMYNTKMALAAVILVLGVVEFVIGIWAAICCCMMRPCACCTRQQVSYLKKVRISTPFPQTTPIDRKVPFRGTIVQTYNNTSTTANGKANPLSTLHLFIFSLDAENFLSLFISECNWLSKLG